MCDPNRGQRPCLPDAEHGPAGLRRDFWMHWATLKKNLGTPAPEIVVGSGQHASLRKVWSRAWLRKVLRHVWAKAFDACRAA